MFLYTSYLLFCYFSHSCGICKSQFEEQSGLMCHMRWMHGVRNSNNANTTVTDDNNTETITSEEKRLSDGIPASLTNHSTALDDDICQPRCNSVPATLEELPEALANESPASRKRRREEFVFGVPVHKKQKVYGQSKPRQKKAETGKDEN